MAGRKSKDSGPGRGGSRAGAGRPREPKRRTKDAQGKRSVSWVRIRQLARLGAEKNDILLTLRIDRAMLADPAFAAALEEELAIGQAQLRIDLLQAHSRMRRRSVNAVHRGLSQVIGWGRPDTGKGNRRPDDDAAIADASTIIAKVGS